MRRNMGEKIEVPVELAVAALRIIGEAPARVGAGVYVELTRLLEERQRASGEPPVRE
jgi:hypothetical protein